MNKEFRVSKKSLWIEYQMMIDKSMNLKIFFIRFSKNLDYERP